MAEAASAWHQRQAWQHQWRRRNRKKKGVRRKRRSIIGGGGGQSKNMGIGENGGISGGEASAKMKSRASHHESQKISKRRHAAKMA
jgi:hypothetical protein